MSIDQFIGDQEQDHYVVLGLGKLRYRASQEQIKKACMFNVFFINFIIINYNREKTFIYRSSTI